MTAEPLALSRRVVVIGAGIAGLMTALELAPRPVVVLSKGTLGAEGSTLWAQGGLAAALGPDDSPALHAADTIAAGDGLCDGAIVDRFARAAPAAIERLARLGVRFDRTRDGGFALGLEAAHSRRRVAHCGGDGAGREVMRALVTAARATPSIEILEGYEARRLVVEDNAVLGLLAIGPSGPILLPADSVVIATGGIGGLYEDSTNPPGSFGQGLALAARAGAVLADMEFVQFHPTALDGARRPMPLVSEAVRGEGAILVDDAGERFMAGIPGAELAPRDVVARAIAARRAEGRRVFLDARAAIGARFEARFPVIAEACRAAGVDPAREPIPVRPGAALSHGRDRRGRRGTELDRGPLGVRRGGLHRPPRRQSACEQFADRSRRLRLDLSPARSRARLCAGPARLRAALAPAGARSGAGAAHPVAGGRRHPQRGSPPGSGGRARGPRRLGRTRLRSRSRRADDRRFRAAAR